MEVASEFPTQRKAQTAADAWKNPDPKPNRVAVVAELDLEMEVEFRLRPHLKGNLSVWLSQPWFLQYEGMGLQLRRVDRIRDEPPSMVSLHRFTVSEIIDDVDLTTEFEQ